MNFIDGDLNNSDEHHLKDEVEKLHKERAALLSETKKHNETLREKTSQITQEYTTIIEQKNKRIEKVRYIQVPDLIREKTKFV